MRPRLVAIGVVSLGLLGLGVLLGVTHSRQPTAESHILALCRLRYPPAPKRLGDYLSRDYLLWNLQGRLTSLQVNQRKTEHWESLAALGYVQRRTFTLKHRTLEDPMELQKLLALHRNK